MKEHDLLIKDIMETSNIESLQKNDLHTKLAAVINHLILHDFDELIRILYRIDVNEQKLKQLLKEHEDVDAGEMMATLMLERQAQKIKSRLEHGRENNIIDEEEKW